MSTWPGSARWPIRDLLEAGVSSSQVRRHLGGTEYRTAALKGGLTDRQADRVAVHFGLVPREVWPDWDVVVPVEELPDSPRPRYGPRAKSRGGLVVDTPQGQRPRYADVCLCDPARRDPTYPPQCDRCGKVIVVSLRPAVRDATIADWPWFANQQVVPA